MILVTGATGTAGSQVVRALLERESRRCAPSCAIRTRRAALLRRGGRDRGRRLRRRALGARARSRARRTCSSRAPTIRAGSGGRRPRSTRPRAQACAGSSSSRRSRRSRARRSPSGTGTAGSSSTSAAPASAAVVLRSSFFMSNLLAAAEQVAREGRLYAPAGDGADRDDRPARRRRGRRGRAHDGGPRRADLRPHRPRGDHLRRGGGARSRPRPAATWSSSTSPTTTRRAGADPGRPARFVAEQIVAIFALRAQGVGAAGHGDGRVADRPRAARLRRVRARPRALFAPVAETAAGDGRQRSPRRGRPMTLEANKALVRRVFEDVIPGRRPGRHARAGGPGLPRSRSAARPAGRRWRAPSTWSPRCTARTRTCASRSTTWSPRRIGSRSAGRCTEPTPARCSASRRPVSRSSSRRS